MISEAHLKRKGRAKPPSNTFFGWKTKDLHRMKTIQQWCVKCTLKNICHILLCIWHTIALFHPVQIFGSSALCIFYIDILHSINVCIFVSSLISIWCEAHWLSSHTPCGCVTALWVIPGSVLLLVYFTYLCMYNFNDEEEMLSCFGNTTKLPTSFKKSI